MFTVTPEEAEKLTQMRHHWNAFLDGAEAAGIEASVVAAYTISRTLELARHLAARDESFRATIKEVLKDSGLT